jgi:hypothetical protein
MQRIKWGPKDVIKPDRVRSIKDEIFAWMNGNILHSGLLEEMTTYEFKLYGFYCLAGDGIYSMSSYTVREITKILKTTPNKIQKARESLLEKDLIAYESRTFTNKKGLKYKRIIIQVLSLPTDRIVIERRRKQGARPVVVERVIQGVDQTPRWQSPPTHIREEIKKIIGEK